MLFSKSKLSWSVRSTRCVPPTRPGWPIGETLVGLHRQLERLGAVLTRAVAAFDAGRAWDAERARSASAWLAVRWIVAQRSARRRVLLGRALREMPSVEAACWPVISARPR